MYRTFRASGLALGIALSLLAVPVFAAPAPSKLAIATLDVDRVMAESTASQSRQRELQTEQTQMQKQLDNVFEGRFLKDDERTELEKIQQAPNPTAQQQARREELRKLVDSRNEEFNKLDKQATRTDAEQIRYTELLNIILKQKARAEQLNQKLTDDLQQKTAAVATEVQGLVKDAIDKVATQMGLDMVVDRKAVLFATKQTDITDAVLRELNKGK